MGPLDGWMDGWMSGPLVVAREVGADYCHD